MRLPTRCSLALASALALAPACGRDLALHEPARREPAVPTPAGAASASPTADAIVTGTSPTASWLADLPAPAPGAALPATADTGAFTVDAAGDVYAVYPYDGVLAVLPADGSAPRVLARTRPLPVAEQLFDVAVDATHVWFTSVVRSADGAHAAYALRRVPKAGGPAEVLSRGDLPANGLATTVLVDAAQAWFLRAEAPGDGYTYAVVRIPKAGGPEGVVTTGLTGFQPLALDGDWLYLSPPGGGVARVPKGGGSAVPLAPAEDLVRAVVVSPTHVYYSVRDPDGSGWHLYRAPKEGGPREDVGTYEGVGADLWFDAGSLYWAEDTSTVAMSPDRIVARAETLAPQRTVVEAVTPGAYWRVQGGRAWWGEDPRVASADIAGR